MREIKFRAWNKKHEKLANVTSIFFDKDIVFFDIPAQGVELDKNMKVIRRFESQESWKLSDTDLMQYTGLRDKNGKEIYEGDIIEYTTWKIGHKMLDGTLPRRHKGVVQFDGGGWKLSADASFLMAIYPDKEVIGNIYENGELLKKD